MSWRRAEAVRNVAQPSLDLLHERLDASALLRVKSQCFFQRSMGEFRVAHVQVANAFIGMAIGYLHMGNPELAHAALEEALRLDPEQRGRVEPLMLQIQARLGYVPHGIGAPSGH